jgi:hypothetical protein
MLSNKNNGAISIMALKFSTIDTPIQDKLRLFLGQFGSKEVPITIDEISSALSLSYPQVYQGIKRLQDRGEIDLEKETLPNRAEKIVGIKLIRLEPSSRTYRRAADHAKITLITNKTLPNIEADPSFPLITSYLNKKVAIEELRELALNSGLDSNTIQFEPNEIAEEALALLKMMGTLREQVDKLAKEKQMLEFDVQAEKRNAEAYKSRLRDETQEELREFARKERGERL